MRKKFIIMTVMLMAGLSTGCGKKGTESNNPGTESNDSGMESNNSGMESGSSQVEEQSDPAGS